MTEQTFTQGVTDVRDTAVAAANDADGFFIHRNACTFESYVGIGDECGDYMLAVMDSDRLRAVAVLLLAEAQRLDELAVPQLGAGVAPGVEEYEAARELLRSPELAVDDPYGDLAAARTVIAEYEAAHQI